MKLKSTHRNCHVVNEVSVFFAKALLAVYLDDGFEGVKKSLENSDKPLDIKKKRRIHAPESKHKRRVYEKERAKGY